MSEWKRRQRIRCEEMNLPRIVVVLIDTHEGSSTLKELTLHLLAGLRREEALYDNIPVLVQASLPPVTAGFSR
jgi:hypothetical protein